MNSYKSIIQTWDSHKEFFSEAIDRFVATERKNRIRKVPAQQLFSVLNDLDTALEISPKRAEAQKKRWSAKLFKKVLLIFLIVCGMVHAVSAAFDGINAILSIFGFSNMLISMVCTVFSIIGMVLFFSYELTKLTRGFGLEYMLKIPSSAGDLVLMQKKIVSIRSKLETRMHYSLNNGDMKSYISYQSIYNDLHNRIGPLKQLILHLKSFRETRARKFMNYAFALIAGFLSGAIAFFDGQSLLGVIANLLSIQISQPLLLWMPLVIGGLCFVVIMMVALYSEGRGITRLVDEFRKRPYDETHQQLQLGHWEVPEYQQALMNLELCESRPNSPDIDPIKQAKFKLKFFSENSWSNDLLENDEQLTSDDSLVLLHP